MSYQRNRTSSTGFKILTGIGVDHFDVQLPYIHEEHDKYFRYQIDGLLRKGGTAAARIQQLHGLFQILRIVKDECRVRKEEFVDLVFHVSSAINNLRMGVKLPL